MPTVARPRRPARVRSLVSFHNLDIVHLSTKQHVRTEQHAGADVDGGSEVGTPSWHCCSAQRSDPRRPLNSPHRLMREYRDLTADPINDMLTAGPVSEDNMLEWEALIQGPEGTPYVSDLQRARRCSPHRPSAGPR